MKPLTGVGPVDALRAVPANQDKGPILGEIADSGFSWRADSRCGNVGEVRDLFPTSPNGSIMSQFARSLTISKSDFLSGSQCVLRLYNEKFRPELADEPDPVQQDIMNAGADVGDLAQMLFPGGILIEQGHEFHERAVEKTQESLADPTRNAIFEAAFTYLDHPIRVDVLERLDDGTFALNEVKSSTQVEPHHKLDLAFQLYVLRELGLPVSMARVIHPDKDYVRPEGDFVVSDYFIGEDFTAEAEGLIPEVERKLPEFFRTLDKSSPPDVSVGSHCNKPVQCPFYTACHLTVPPHAIHKLPRIHESRLIPLIAAGYETIDQIPATYENLTDTQARVRDALLTGMGCFDHDAVAATFKDLSYPLHFLDFEAAQWAIPQFPNSRAHQQIVTQFSNHILHRNGRISHREYLHMDNTDPRPRLLRALTRAVGTEGSIVVYSPYEKSRLQEMAADFPEYRDEIEAICGRLYDLLDVVRKHVYHPDFNESFSIKTVQPVFVPELSYKDLEIQNGGMASQQYKKMVDRTTLPEERHGIASNLLEYCGVDTLAMVRLYQAFRREIRERDMPNPGELSRLAQAAWRKRESSRQGRVVMRAS